MIKQACRWLVSCRKTQRVQAAEFMALKLSQRLKILAKRIDKRQRELTAAQKRVAIISQSAEEDLQAAKETQGQYEEAIEALRSENQILREVTIPTLVSSHKLILQRIDAETSIEVKRMVAMSTNEVE